MATGLAVVIAPSFGVAAGGVAGAVAGAIAYATLPTIAAGIAAVAESPATASIRGRSRRPSRRRPLAMALVTVALASSLASWRAATEHAALDRVEVGMYRGWVTRVGSPIRTFGGIREIISVEGRRFEAWTSGDVDGDLPSAGSPRRLLILGETRLIEGEPGRRRRMEHVVGRLVIHRVIDTDHGSPLDRWRTRTRTVIAAGADHIGDADRSLFLGLIIGDRDQPDRSVTERFRAAGLAHLSVASGHDVALVLIAVGPILVRLRPLARWALTALVVAAFADLVGSEPSITRASVMAMISASAFLGGVRWRAIDVVVLATLVLVLVDPFLVHLPGFWMSVGATAGVVALGPPIARRLARRPDRPGRLATALAVTLGAQAGVALPLVATFGSLPLVALPANLVAVPLGSAIKVYGLPAAVLSGFFPALGPVVMAPVGPMVRALDRVAAVAADLEPGPRWSIVGWCLLAGALVVGRRSWPARAT